jgi:hypothetical protein
LAVHPELLAAVRTTVTRVDEPQRPSPPAKTARAKGRRGSLNLRRVAVLPILNRFPERLRLQKFLHDHLPIEADRTRTPKATAVLLRKLLISDEPLYDVGEWAACYRPDLLGLSSTQL